MTWTSFLLKSLRHHARAHLGVILGAVIGCGVLTGALVVGDSVRGSLRRLAALRLGGVVTALPTGDRFVRDALAEDIAAEIGAGTIAAAVIQSTGIATTEDGSARANQVHFYGVDETFWQLAPTPPAKPPGTEDGVVINERLAAQMGVKSGDTVVLRSRKPSQISRESPVSAREDYSIAMRIPVAAVVTDEVFGRFSLRANQIPPYNAFLPRSRLQTSLDQNGRSNLILVGTASPDPAALDAEAAQAALRAAWTLDDAELRFVHVPSLSAFELRSRRVFLDTPIIRAARAAGDSAQGVLTYFVDSLRRGDRVTPYSIATGIEKWEAIAGMGDDEILVNDWLAEDLNLKKGDSLTVLYDVLADSGRLDRRTNSFRVFGITPIEGLAADRSLLPDFPGVARAEKTADWDTGFPIDFSRIRDRDEAYWDKYRGTPKAFVTLAAAQSMWANRFGRLTAMRYSADGNELSGLKAGFREAMDPADLGLTFQPVRRQGMDASEESFDFGQLFIGFSFFLIVAALLLMVLLFQLGIERRGREIGLLVAMGIREAQVRRFLVGEGSALAMLGCAVGVAAGTAYAHLMVAGLTSIWRDAVGTTALEYHAKAVTLVIGFLAGTFLCSATIWFSVRQHARQSVRSLLTGERADTPDQAKPHRSSRRTPFLIFAGCVVAAVGLAWYGGRLQGPAAAGAFFGAGGLVLAGLLTGCLGWIGRLGRRGAATPSVTDFGIRNVSRRRKRSLSVAGSLACGCFLVIAVEPFHLNVDPGNTDPKSGTGGFTYLGRTTIPVVQDLNSRAGIEFFGLDRETVGDATFVSIRLREGDDASCLNLNRAQQPQIFGVPTAPLAQRGAFTFSGSLTLPENPDLQGWELLGAQLPDGSIPAVADQATIQWALGKKLGDSLIYRDDQGNPVHLKLVGALSGSILQGAILISRNRFETLFPSITGFQRFLIDAPADPKFQAAMTRALADTGLEIIPTWRRLNELNAVQNTYLSTFQILGGLGLILGSAGLGVVVWRNVLERRGELAILEAVGLHRRTIKWMALSEHGFLLLLGLGIGAVAAAVAVVPSLLQSGREIAYGSLLLTLGGVLVSGILWTWVATAFVLRGNLLDALRND